MRESKAKKKTAKKPKVPRPRNTLSKRIATHPVHAAKYWAALLGKIKVTDMTIFPLMAESIRRYNPDNATDKYNYNPAKATSKLRRDFVNRFFPALMSSDIQAFSELIQAMSYVRKLSANIAKVQRQVAAGKYMPSKNETGRLLRLVLLSLEEEDLLSIHTVKQCLDFVNEHLQKQYGNDFSLYPDDSRIYTVMRELNLSFLQPGDWVEWVLARKVVRRMEIQPDGKAIFTGFSRSEVSKNHKIWKRSQSDCFM